MKKTFWPLCRENILFTTCILLFVGCDKPKESTQAEQKIASDLIRSASVATPIPVRTPKSWSNRHSRVGNFQEILEFSGLSFQASEFHEEDSPQGAHVDSVFAFWLRNQTQAILRTRKVTAFLYNANGEPIAGFEMQPAKGENSILFKPDDSHVLPFWLKSKSVVPDRIAILVESENRPDSIYVLVGLSKMSAEKWDGRSWLKGSKFEGARVVHPRHYNFAGQDIDIKSASEIFLGPGKMENVFYDLGHDESWFESRSADENNPATYFIIVPYDAARLTSAFQ